MKINTANLKNSRQLSLFILDFIMIGLVTINLLWLIFDTIYATAVINDYIALNIPLISQHYDPIHANFIFFDLIFISIFLTEFVFRWIVSVYKKDYLRWYFYPFIHWYDLVGCIPVGPYRVLRFLRIISICYRLQKYQIVDFSNWAIIRFFVFYYNVFIEEISDRVVINVLSGAQKEISTGSPFFEKVSKDILLPKKKLLVDWLSNHIEEKASHILLDKREELNQYVSTIVGNAVENNDEVHLLKQTPLLGSKFVDTLNHTVSDIVYKTIENLLKDLSSAQNRPLIEELTDLLLTSTHKQTLTDEHLRALLIEILEATKEQVSVQNWKADLI